MSPLPLRQFKEPLRSSVMRSIYRQGVRKVVIEQAMLKWEHGGKPEMCVEELKGKPSGLETGCKCVGCLEALCFVMFTQVHRRLTEHH